MDKRKAAGPAESRKFPRRYGRCETGDNVIRGVSFENEPCPIAPCLSIILEVRPVVVPVSTRWVPARFMMSGSRNDPPISISSPRETIVSLPPARVLSVRSTAAALLLTTQASSAPVSSQMRPRTWSSRSPRPPVARSYSSATGSLMACTAASIAASGRMARPRLVWSTVPVRLKTGLMRGASSSSAS